MKQLNFIIYLLLISCSLAYAGDPREGKEKGKDGSEESAVVIDVESINKQRSVLLEKVSHAVLKNIIQQFDEQDLGSGDFSTLSDGIQYDNALCLYIKMPDEEIMSAMIQEMLPIAQREIAVALNELPGIKGTFDGLNVSLFRVQHSKSYNSTGDYHLTVTVRNPRLVKDNLSINLDAIIWEAKLPRISSAMEGEDSGQTLRFDIDQQKLKFENPVITIDGMKIKLKTDSDNHEKDRKTFAEIDLHISSSNDVQYLNYDISRMRFDLPNPDDENYKDKPIGVVRRGEVSCEIECGRLQGLPLQKQAEIIGSFNKLGNLVWQRLTSVLNQVISNYRNDLRFDSLCLPIDFKKPVSDMPLIGITPKHPNFISDETIKLRGVLSFSRCNSDALQIYSAELIQHHGDLESIHRFLSSEEGTNSVDKFIDDQEKMRILQSLGRSQDQLAVHRLSGAKKEDDKRGFMYSELEERAYLEEIVGRLVSDDIDSIRPLDNVVLRVMPENAYDLLLQHFDKLKTNEEKILFYDDLDSLLQRWIIGGHYIYEIKDRTWEIVYSGDENIDYYLETIPGNLRDYARRRYENLKYYKDKLFDNPGSPITHDGIALSTMRENDFDVLLEVDIDAMNLIANGLTPELGKDYLYILPSTGADNEFNLVGGERVDIGSTLQSTIDKYGLPLPKSRVDKQLPVQFGIQFSAGITSEGRLTPSVLADSSREPAVWGYSPIIPNELIRRGVLEKINLSPVDSVYGNRLYAVKLDKPKNLVPHHREIYSASTESGGEEGAVEFFSLEGRPSSLVKHFVDSSTGLWSQMFSEADLFKYIRPSRFIVKDGKFMVGFQYEDLKKEMK